MNKKKFIIGLAIILVAFLGYMLWKKNNGNTVQVGAIIPLTGPGADYGKSAIMGIELAESELNSKDTILKVNIEDSKTDPTAGVSALNKLMSYNGIQAYITFVSGVVQATSPISESKNVVLINTLAQSPGIRNLGPYTFSIINDANIETFQMAEYVFKTYKKIGILYSSATYGVTAKDAMVTKFKALGGEVVDIQEFKEGERNFSPYIEKFKSQDIQAVFAPGVSDDIGFLIKQSFEKNYRPQWYSFTAFEGQDVLDIAKGAAEGAIYTSTTFDINSSEQLRQFAASFEKKFNKKPDLYAASAYDGTMLLGMAIKEGNKSGEEIKRYLENMGTYNGVTGQIKFDKDGCVNKPVVFKTIRNGMFVQIK